MICTECSFNDIQCLFYQYRRDYIKLTACPLCGQIADKYIEYDNVILFIDTLLLKKQAYMHLAYNTTENNLLMVSRSIKTTSLQLSFARYRPMYRLLMIFTLFHVYLTWAYEEKREIHSPAISYILLQKPHVQYVFSVLQLILEQAALHLTIQYMFRSRLGWNRSVNNHLSPDYQSGYYTAVLSKTIMVSQSTKLFPILMLIWPYDNTNILAPLINLVGFVNTIEALRIVTLYQYKHIFMTMILAIMMQSLVSILLLGVWVCNASISDFWFTLCNEFSLLFDISGAINATANAKAFFTSYFCA